MSFNLKYLSLSLLLLLIGCGSGKIMSDLFVGKPSTTDTVVTAVAESTETLTVLSGVGGICLLAGMALLVISRGTMGWRPFVGGILLILLNYVVARYADWIFIPVLIATGAISAAWGWNTILEIYKERSHV